MIIFLTEGYFCFLFFFISSQFDFCVLFFEGMYQRTDKGLSSERIVKKLSKSPSPPQKRRSRSPKRSSRSPKRSSRSPNRSRSARKSRSRSRSRDRHPRQSRDRRDHKRSRLGFCIFPIVFLRKYTIIIFCLLSKKCLRYK